MSTTSKYHHEKTSLDVGFDPDLHVSADLNLTGREQISLVVALEDVLRGYGVRPDGSGGDYAPGSHLDTLVSLAKRVRMMRLGVMRWNERPA